MVWEASQKRVPFLGVPGNSLNKTCGESAMPRGCRMIRADRAKCSCASWHVICKLNMAKASSRKTSDVFSNPNTLQQETNISPWEDMFEDDFAFPMLGYVSFLTKDLEQPSRSVWIWYVPGALKKTRFILLGFMLLYSWKAPKHEKRWGNMSLEPNGHLWERHIWKTILHENNVKIAYHMKF